MFVIPESVLSLLTWSDLETGVCGDRLVTLAQLKIACNYGFACFYFCTSYCCSVHG